MFSVSRSTLGYASRLEARDGPLLDMARLPSPESVALWYFGKQLDVGDQDTYLTALMLAKGVAPDNPIVINRTEFLRLMGRKVGGSGFKWLE